MNQFAHFSVHGFRRLFDIELDLRSFSVIIGANGSGKTSFLDVFSLLAASARGELNTKIGELSGLSALMTYDKAESLSIGLKMPVSGHEPLEYSLDLQPQGTTYLVNREILSQQRIQGRPPFKHIDSDGQDIKYFETKQNRWVRPTWQHNHLETSLSQVPKMFEEPETFRRSLASSTFYHVLNVDSRSAVRLPQPMRPAPLPGKDGEDLVPCLYYLRETDHNRFDAIEDTLKAAFPDFERLDFPPIAAGTIAMSWKDRNFRHPIYTHQLSEGTLRFLWLLALLQSPSLTAVTLIDEPEVSLHPELLSILADVMREASSRTQLIVATHSDRLVRFLNPNETLVVDVKEDGQAKLTWADSLDLEQWLKDYSLDQVWRMGRMGGRPCE